MKKKIRFIFDITEDYNYPPPSFGGGQQDYGQSNYGNGKTKNAVFKILKNNFFKKN